MASLISPHSAQLKLAKNLRKRRLMMNFTQEALSQRSGVALATLRAFERKGKLSLTSLCKLMSVLGALDELVKASELSETRYESIDDVLRAPPLARKRARSK